MENSRIGQIAIVVRDWKRSARLYEDAFGLEHVFGTCAFRGETAARVQGIPDVASSTRWLIDNRELFQLEIFQFDHPRSSPLSDNHGVTDTGYNRILFAVTSLEKATEQANRLGCVTSALLFGHEPQTPPHALLTDPDGILLELVEAPHLVAPGRTSMLIGLGLTTPDLETTVADMVTGFGFEPCADHFDQAVFWQESGQLEAHQTLRLDDMYLVVSQYRHCRSRPADYRLSDIGIMNFAIAFRDQSDFATCYRRTTEMGMEGNCEPLIAGGQASMVYNNTRLGFSVEMIYISRKLWGLYGFARPTLLDRLVNRVLEWKSQRLYKKQRALSSRGS